MTAPSKAPKADPFSSVRPLIRNLIKSAPNEEKFSALAAQLTEEGRRIYNEREFANLEAHVTILLSKIKTTP